VGWLGACALLDLKTRVTLVQKKSLAPGVREALGITLPEDQVDVAAYPHVHAAAVACPLVVLTREQHALALDHGLTVYIVAMGSGEFELATEGHETRRWAAMIDDLAVRDVATGDLDPRFDAEDVLQRLALAISSGVLDACSIQLALELALALGARGEYYGNGKRSSASEIEDALSSWNAWLAEVFARSQSHEKHARSVAHAVANADPRTDEIVCVHYGVARKRTEPGIEVAIPESKARGMMAAETIMLPSRACFTVENVEWWEPARSRMGSSGRDMGGAKGLPMSPVYITVGVVVAAFLAAWILSR
jgi:hypothetical protein